MILRNVPFAFAFLLVSAGALQAQQTVVYLDQQRQFEEAGEYYNDGMLAVAQKKYGDFLRSTQNNFLPEVVLMRTEAAFRQAICARRLNNPDAEFLLVKFIDEQTHAKYVGLAYYELAGIYFENKNYRDLIAISGKVDISDLPADKRAEYSFQLAYSYFTAKQFDKAQRLFAAAINTQNQYYYDANYYYGIIAFFKDDYDTALNSFSRIDKQPKYANSIPYYITQIYFLQGRDDELLAYAVPKAQDTNIKHFKEINYIVGQTYFKRQEFERALPYLEYYIDNTRKVDKSHLYQLAFAQYKLKQYGKAIDNFSELNTLNEELGQNAMYHLADCYLQTGEKSKAYNAFDRAAQMDFDPKIKEVSAFNAAKLSYELGFHSDAIARLQAFMGGYPNSAYLPEAQRLLSELFETTRNYKDALDMLETMPNKTPELWRTYQRVAYYRGVEMFNDQKLDEAMELFNKSLENQLDPDVAALSHFWKGDIYYRKAKYDETFNEMETFLGTSGGKTFSDKVSPSSANYTIGYSLFKQKEYEDALYYFDQVVSGLQGNAGLSNRKSPQSQIYPDALLRRGDCYFMLKKYALALKSYDAVLQYDLAGADYAYYQKGMLAGLLGDHAKKISELYTLIQKHPNSLYTDDALYQIALTQVALEDYQAAIQTHQRIINDHKDSEYVPKSLTNLGLIHFNLGQYDKSLSFYKLVLERFPNSPEAKAALLAVRDVFIAKGDSEGYGRFIRNFPGVDFSPSAQDTLSYEIAEKHYTDGNCDKAIAAFGKYLDDYPTGAYTLYARFYRAQCLYSQKRYQQAGSDYEHILKQPRNLFTEQSLDKAARIAHFINEDYATAFKHYKSLYEITSRKELALDALRGLLRTAYELNNTQAVTQYAALLRQNANADSEDIIDTHYFPALMAYRQNNFAKAKPDFEQVASRTQNEKGAQARYFVAEINFKEGNLDATKTWCYKVINETSSQEYWVVKSFLLLGDMYYAKGDLFQAKATFDSIVKGYDKEDELKQEARQKLEKITAEEQLKTKVKSDNPNGDLELDNR